MRETTLNVMNDTIERVILTKKPSPTKSSRMTASEIEEIFDLIPERFHAGVLDGTLTVRGKEHWYSPDKPVIVESHNNHIKHGRYATANDPAIVSRQTAYKRKKGYQEMQHVYIGAEPGEHEKQIISLKEIIDALWDAANGSPQYIDCPHPELHTGRDIASLKHAVAFKKDPNALFKLYENLVGKATETSEINVNQTSLVKLLQDRTPLTEVTVIDMTPTQVYERRKLLEEEVAGETKDEHDQG